MKRYIAVSLLLLSCFAAKAQTDDIFRRTVYCNEYDIYIVMNFYDKDVIIKGEEFLDKMDGYLGDWENSRKWLILDTELISDNVAALDMINIEGSEDLKATLTFNGDGTYTLRQVSGSTLKIARGNKWQKLPKTMVFTTTRSK